MTQNTKSSAAFDPERRNDAQRIEGWDRSAISKDAFLNGRVTVFQPLRGFRAGMDSVMLAAAVPAIAGENVFELGMGVGVAALCLAARIPGLNLTGLEIDQSLVALATANVRSNAHSCVINARHGDAMRLDRDIPRGHFDHVMTNPPFLDANNATTGPHTGKAQAIASDAVSMDQWFKSALSVLKPNGTLTLVQRADMLPDILRWLLPGTGDIEIIPLYPRASEPAIRLIVRATKGRRGPMRILTPLVLHQPDGTFTDQAQAVLRNGAGLFTSHP